MEWFMRDQPDHRVLDPSAGWRGSAQALVVGAVLALVELGLVRLAGAPGAHLRVLRQLGDPWAEPLASVLAMLALAAEGLVAYLLAVLLLRSLSALPGAAGRLAARASFVVTPAVVRRTVDLVLGGVLLVQTTVALAAPARPGPPADRLQAATASLPVGMAAGAPAGPVREAPASSHQPSPGSGTGDSTGPVETRPAPRRSSVPLPPWLSGGPSSPVPDRATTEGTGATAGTAGSTGDAVRSPGRHVVVPDDTLWDIAAAHLRPAARSTSNIHRYWQRIYRANRCAIGPDPDLIHPGTRLDLPPYRLDRR
jgi:nucleoid-associated protein YgaU